MTEFGTKVPYAISINGHPLGARPVKKKPTAKPATRAAKKPAKRRSKAPTTKQRLDAICNQLTAVQNVVTSHDAFAADINKFTAAILRLEQIEVSHRTTINGLNGAHDAITRLQKLVPNEEWFLAVDETSKAHKGAIDYLQRRDKATTELFAELEKWREHLDQKNREYFDVSEALGKRVDAMEKMAHRTSQFIPKAVTLSDPMKAMVGSRTKSVTRSYNIRPNLSLSFYLADLGDGQTMRAAAKGGLELTVTRDGDVIRINFKGQDAPEPQAGPTAAAEEKTPSESSQAAGARETAQTEPGNEQAADWFAERTYSRGQCVEYRGKRYRCMMPCAGVAPRTNRAYWQATDEAPAKPRPSMLYAQIESGSWHWLIATGEGWHGNGFFRRSADLLKVDRLSSDLVCVAIFDDDLLRGRRQPLIGT